MVGTKAGGLKAAKTNKERNGEDFYKRIGQKGGKIIGKKGGFASEKVGEDGLTGLERARIAGKKGGSTSRRTGVKNGEGKTPKKKVKTEDKAEAKAERRVLSFISKAFGRSQDAE